MAHIHEKIDFTVETFVVYKSRGLLRKHDKYKLWLSVGGYVELDEDPNEAAIREVKEEVGLDVALDDSHVQFHWEIEGYKELIPPHFLNRHRGSDSHEHVSMYFFARATTDQVVVGSEDRSDEWHWFSLEELDDPPYNLSKNVRFSAKKALETLADYPA